MSDLGELIRDCYESVADPVTVEEILYGAIGEGLVRPLGTPLVRTRRRFRGRLGTRQLPPLDEQRRDRMTDSKIDQPTPGPRSPRVRRGLAIGAAAALVVIVGVVAFAFVADDGTDVAGSAGVASGPITSFEDIAGTIYKQVSGHSQLYFQFFEDGTFHLSTSQLFVEDALAGAHIYETRFEETKLFVKALKETKYSCDDDPIYEIHLLENGNLQLVAIEDPCGHRLGDWQAEWEPVPELSP